MKSFQEDGKTIGSLDMVKCTISCWPFQLVILSTLCDFLKIQMGDLCCLCPDILYVYILFNTIYDIIGVHSPCSLYLGLRIEISSEMERRKTLAGFLSLSA